MRATAFFFLTFASLAFGSAAVATSTHHATHKSAVSKATKAGSKGKSPMTKASINTPALADGALDPAGFVVVEDRPYVPTTPKAVPVMQWKMHSGELLSAVVARWCAKAGWQPPQWQADVDYSIKADASFEGDLIAALGELMESYRHAKKPLHAAIYPPQRLVYVTFLSATDAQ